MSEASKNLATKNQVEFALDKRQKEMEYKNFKHLICINFIGKSYFGNDESQNYLIFQPVLTLFQTFCGTVDKNLG